MGFPRQEYCSGLPLPISAKKTILKLTVFWGEKRQAPEYHLSRNHFSGRVTIFTYQSELHPTWHQKQPTGPSSEKPFDISARDPASADLHQPPWGRDSGSCRKVPPTRPNRPTDALVPVVAQTVRNPPAIQETQVWSLGWDNPLEKGMAAHSCILVWRIPWTEEPDRLQSTGSQSRAQLTFTVPVSEARVDLEQGGQGWPSRWGCGAVRCSYTVFSIIKLKADVTLSTNQAPTPPHGITPQKLILWFYAKPKQVFKEWCNTSEQVKIFTKLMNENVPTRFLGIWVNICLFKRFCKYFLKLIHYLNSLYNYQVA